jgi:hypothetical protein
LLPHHDGRFPRRIEGTCVVAVNTRELLRSALFRLLGTIITADRDLLITNLDLDPSILDFPIAHRALLRSHENPLVSRKTRKSRHDSHEGMVESREMSDFQILAHFAQPVAAAMATHFRRAAAKLAAKSVGKVAVAGKADLEGERGEISRPA